MVLTHPPHPDIFHRVPTAYHDYLDVFSESQANTLPPHRKYDLAIPLQPGTAPPWGPIYSMSAPKLAKLKEYVTSYLANGFIRPSQAPAVVSVMFVKRPNGKLRLVVDYKGLNRVTVKNKFPLPLIPEMLDRPHLAKVFTIMLGPLPLVTSAPIVSVPNPHLHFNIHVGWYFHIHFLVKPTM